MSSKWPEQPLSGHQLLPTPPDQVVPHGRWRQILGPRPRGQRPKETMWEILAPGVRLQNGAGAVGHLSLMHMAGQTRPGSSTEPEPGATSKDVHVWPQSCVSAMFTQAHVCIWLTVMCKGCAHICACAHACLYVHDQSCTHAILHATCPSALLWKWHCLH